jgi:hypothetical protein
MAFRQHQSAPFAAPVLGDLRQTIKQCHKIRSSKQKKTTDLIDKPRTVVWDWKVNPRTDALSSGLARAKENKSAGMREPTG